MVNRISDNVKQVLSEEEAEKKKQQLRAKLLKIKLAALGPATTEARRGLIQDTPVSGSEGNQNKLRQNNDYIKTKKPIRPTGADAEFTDKQSMAKEHGHAIVFKGVPVGPYKVASLVENQGHYAKYWLLNAKQTNGNGWGIAAHTAKDNMSKFIGRPLVVTASSWHGASQYGDSYEHPYLATNDMNQIFAHQEKFRVGNIVAVEGDKNGDYFATIEMLPKFANMVLPPFCSPAIYQLDAQEHEGNISKWEALHLAALDENPAYGARIALLKGTCVGTSSSCSIQFKSAKLETKVACPIKVKGKLAALKKKQKIRLKLAGRFDNKGGFKKFDSFKNKGIDASFTVTMPGGVEDSKKNFPKTSPQKRKSGFENFQIEKKINNKLGNNSIVTNTDGTDVDKIASPETVINSFRENRMKKIAKIKLKLAALGMDNMTYQDSKKVKIIKKKHPEVRKAALDMADILRKTGSSKDGMHAHSTWMTKSGEFVGGGEAHVNQIIDADPAFHKSQGDVESDEIVTNFAKKHELIRVQSFPVNRAGESRTSFGIHHKPSAGQLRSMKALEDSGEVVGHATGPDHRTATTGEGFKSIRQSIGKHFP